VRKLDAALVLAVYVYYAVVLMLVPHLLLG
jgi:hypothetical protein